MVKLKRLPEDFQVEEITEFKPTECGEYSLYHLTKRGLGTPEAVEAICRRWRIPRSRISYGGLKDRHAETSQFVTIWHGPHRNMHQTNLWLAYLGQAPRAYCQTDITCNRFCIVLRELTEQETGLIVSELRQVSRDGLPNYFGDQRFGSVGLSGEFVAQAWISANYERALWLALADSNPQDRSRERQQKEMLRLHWGDWHTCKQKLKQSPRQRVIAYLCHHPTDFRRALARIQAELRSLYLAAFQSHLWNRLLGALLTKTCGPDQLVFVHLKTGTVPFYTSLNDQIRHTIQSNLLPLPSSRIRLEEGPVKTTVDTVLEEFGLQLRHIRVKYPRDSFFSKGWRRTTFSMHSLAYEITDDELYNGYRKLTLRCELPRGSYATILLQRVTLHIKPTRNGSRDHD